MKSEPIAECAQCGKPFYRMNTMQTVCGRVCATRMVKAKRAQERAELRQRREALKPRKKWLKDAQDEFNAWVRARDAGKGCISCGTHNGKQNAGHYLSVGARPELRYEPLNVHLQCERCNTYLHGNLIAYRAELIRRIGLSEVEALEGPHAPRKYTVDDLRAIRDEYRAKLKELECKSP